jgi:hypothetical protein
VWTINARSVLDKSDGDLFKKEDKTFFQLLTRIFHHTCLRTLAILVTTDGAEFEDTEDDRNEIRASLNNALFDTMRASVKPEIPVFFLNPRYDKTNEEERQRFDKEAERFYEKVHEFHHKPAIETRKLAELHEEYGKRVEELTKQVM